MIPRTLPTSPRVILSSPRRPAYGALVLFLAVYIGALAIIFAPQGSFQSKPGAGSFEVQP